MEGAEGEGSTDASHNLWKSQTSQLFHEKGIDFATDVCHWCENEAGIVCIILFAPVQYINLRGHFWKGYEGEWHVKTGSYNSP